LCVYQHAPTPHAPGIYRHRTYFAELVRRGWHVDLIATPINYMTGEVPRSYERRPYVHEELDGIDMHWVWASRKIHTSVRHRAANYATFFLTALGRAATLPRPDVLLVSSPPLPVAVLGRHHRLRGLLADLLEDRVGALVEQAGHVARRRVAPVRGLARFDDGREAAQRVGVAHPGCSGVGL